MEVIILLILVSLILAGAFLAVFVWATRSGQFEDTATPPLRVLLDDSPAAAGGGAVDSPHPNPKQP